MKELSKKNVATSRGITLIALVITIIVMLILVSVTISIAINGGLFEYAGKAVSKTSIEKEREAVLTELAVSQIDKYVEGENTKLGIPLHDRTLENSSIWDIVVSNSNNKTYGNNWNYVSKGTKVRGYGETKYDWVINYETGEIVELEKDTYKEYSYKSTIAVTDGLLFNLDSANVGLDKASWGDNATLYYYDDKTYDTIEQRKAAYENEKNKDVTTYVGYDRQKSSNTSEYIDEKTNAFNFNGNNYIEIYNENGFDFTNGLTFEFYGNISGNVAATVSKEESYSWNTWCGLFGLWNGKYNNQCHARFGYNAILKNLSYSLMSEGDRDVCYGEWSNTSSPWNQIKNIGDIFNKDVYFVIALDNIEEDRINQSIYLFIDGKMHKYTGWLLKTYYTNFIETAKNLNYLELGRCTYGNSSNWGYLKGLCYSTRIYNRALNETEVNSNYETTSSFHNYITENNGN